MLQLEDDHRLRQLAAALGVAVGVFGIGPAVAPGTFARLFGLPGDAPALRTAIRSVGVRDAVSGAGLCSAAMHGGKYAPWLLARLLTDAGDAVSVALTFAQGGGNGRLGALGLLALGAAGVDAALWRAARRVGQREVEDLAPLDY